MGRVNIEQISTEEKKAMARCLLGSMSTFFSDPENQKKFQEWQKRQKNNGRLSA